MAIVVEKYSTEALEPVVNLLAHAFLTNPLHVSAFGAQQLDLNRLFFRFGLRQTTHAEAFVGLADGEIRGYMHFNPSPYCLPLAEALPGAMAPLVKPLGKASARLIQWFARWCRLDPDEPHLHLGPIGVTPELQGHGIGTALMNCYIDRLRQANLSGYLETDRPENVEFYRKFGFEVAHEEELIGTPTWYMWRAKESLSKK